MTLHRTVSLPCPECGLRVVRWTFAGDPAPQDDPPGQHPTTEYAMVFNKYSGGADQDRGCRVCRMTSRAYGWPFMCCHSHSNPDRVRRLSNRVFREQARGTQ